MFVGLDHLARALEIVTVVTRCKDSLPIYRTGPAWSAQLAMLKVRYAVSQVVLLIHEARRFWSPSRWSSQADGQSMKASVVFLLSACVCR